MKLCISYLDLQYLESCANFHSVKGGWIKYILRLLALCICLNCFYCTWTKAIHFVFLIYNHITFINHIFNLWWMSGYFFFLFSLSIVPVVVISPERTVLVMILRTKVKVEKSSWIYVTHRSMVMHSCAKHSKIITNEGKKKRSCSPNTTPSQKT